MQRTKLLLLLVVVMLLGAAYGLSALGLDVELKGGGGMAMGTTDDSNKSGELRYALDAGLALDLYVLELGKLSLGFSAGAGYANLHYHGVWENYPDPTFAIFTTQTSDSAYNYLLFPVGVVGKLAMGANRSLTVRAGAFAGLFLGGTTDLDYETDMAPFWVDGEYDLDDSNTELWMYGLSFYAGMDVFKRGRLSICPSLQFDIGLTDTTVPQEIAPGVVYPPDAKDTFWALTANVGIRYSLLE